MSGGAPLAAAGGERTISLYHIHTKETLTVTYKRDGRYVPEALKQINWLMRDWRENEEIEIDPKTIDLLWEMHEELGSKEPIHIICGYRSNKTNNMLRRTVGGQAKGSLHITGKAIDAAFPDVPVKQMRYSALVRERGGVGYYPTSGIPFVHIDSGPVRAWPRLPRHELALLFPSGQSKHRPASGGPITREDVRLARTRHKELAQQVAQFFDLRDRPRQMQVAAASPPARVAPVPPVKAAAGVEVAALEPAALLSPDAAPAAVVPDAEPNPVPPDAVPKLKSPPLLVRAAAHVPPSDAERGHLNELVRLAAYATAEPAYRRPPERDRNRLEQLVAGASLAALGGPDPQPVAARAADAGVLPRSGGLGGAMQIAALEPERAGEPPEGSNHTDAAGLSNGWTPAPEFDEDHPEELTYRPFPVAPFLTQSASADDSALVKITHPDAARTLDLLDNDDLVLPLRLRPARQTAQALWAQQFEGSAVDLSVLDEAQRARDTPTRLAERKVRTTAR